MKINPLVMHDLYRKAKENLLADGYGKYDLIEKIFPAEQLLYEKPRVLKAAICTKLELENSAINYQTFWHWLSRYRAKRLKTNTGSEKQNVFTENKAKDEWQDFHPTNPRKENSQRPPPLSLHPVHYDADTDDE